MRRSRGLTLIEGLFSMLIVSLVLGGLANTLTNAGKVRANRVNMDRASDELHTLQLLRADIYAGLQLLAPTASASSPEVRLRRINPQLSFFQRIDVTQGPELPFEPSEQVEVVYRVEDGVLQKATTAPGAPPRKLRLLPVERFEARRDNTLVIISVTFAYERGTKERLLKVDLR